MKIIKDDEQFKVFSRRAFVMAGLQIFGLGVLGTRLGWLQIVEGKRYKMLSDKNRINIRMLAPPRGQIVDRFGVPLAVNVQNFRLLVIPEQVENLEEALLKARNYIAIEDSDIKRILKEAKRNSKFIPLKVREDLPWEDVARVEVNLTDLSGFMIDTGEIRRYPFAGATAHIVGYVRTPSEKDLTGDPILTLPGFKIGKSGIEKVYETELRGQAGATDMEVNVHGREVRELDRRSPIPGTRIALTIDAELQRYTQEVLAQHKSASAVIMDAVTGAVYALASSPAFDPNLFVRGIPNDIYQAMMADEGRPQTNKAIAGQYPPGSTFKMVTALAGLKTGVIKPNTSVYCPGHYSYGDSKFHCWKKEGHGTVNVITALQHSCDTFFYKLSTEIGIDNIAAMARLLGLGSVLDFELATEEKEGLVPDVAWKRKALKTSWQAGETIVASIGQGYMQATPLQLAVMTARLANGGKKVFPWVTGAIGDEIMRNKEWEDLGIDKDHLALVLQGMNSVMNVPGGTAYGSRINIPGQEMAGKTGTAQVQRITAEQRRLKIQNKDLPWKQRHHALFVGYAPVHDPRYVVSVVVEHGVGGSSAAAPVAKDLMIRTQARKPALSSVLGKGPSAVSLDNFIGPLQKREE